MIFDYCVIGGGVVGSATARALLQRHRGASLLLVEKEPGVARHQTGHNSGVIHSGVYYTPGSLKARLCREGAARLREFCAENAIPVVSCGKLLVATDDADVVRLGALIDRAAANGVSLERLDASGLRAVEPHVSGIDAALIPSTAVVDFRRVTAALIDGVRARGGEVVLGAPIEHIIERSDAVEVRASTASWRARKLVVCAGLQADRVARAAGLDVTFRVVPFRGEYFRLPPHRDNLVEHLIYPIPDPALPFLGVHLTRTTDGGITVGPNAVLALSRERYRKGAFSARDVADFLSFPGMWRFGRQHLRVGVKELRDSWSRRRYLEQCRRFCPELTVDDLLPSPAGIRAQVITRDGSMVEDFMLLQTERMVHVINAPSPAATASLPIGDHIARLVG